MHLNHLDLPVANLAEARAFFEDLLGFQLLVQHGDAIAILSDGNGFTLALANAAHFGGTDPRYPEGFHVGFLLAQTALVVIARHQLRRVFLAGAPSASALDVPSAARCQSVSRRPSLSSPV